MVTKCYQPLPATAGKRVSNLNEDPFLGVRSQLRSQKTFEKDYTKDISLNL